MLLQVIQRLRTQVCYSLEMSAYTGPRLMARCCAIIVFGSVLLGSRAYAEAEHYGTHPGASAFIEQMSRDHGFDKAELQQLFESAKHKERIIELMTSPAEAKPWKDYRPILVTEQRIQQGRVFMKEHAVALERAAAIYGVPPEIIVAIIGVETRYGRITGGFRVVDALATLAFDYPRRSKFFTKELREYLLLSREEQLDPLAMKGSYAGAMGYGQFMPSSFRAYAIDFDGDGRKDIWNNPVDAIGSVANYFSRHGWQPNGPVAVLASASGEHDYENVIVKSRKHLKPRHELAELLQMGISLSGEWQMDQPATLMRLEGKRADEYWVGLHNFYVITRYNHSALYGMAVHQLSRKIINQEYKNG